MTGREAEAAVRHYQWITAIVLVLLLAGTVVGVLVPAGLGWDFANFYDAGRKAAAGDFAHLYDVYSPIAGAAPQGTMQFWGTPISTLFYIPLGMFSPASASMLFKLQNTLALFLALGLVWVSLRRLVDSSAIDQWRFTATFAAVSLLFQPFWTVYRVGGQTMPTVFLLLVLALLAYQARQEAMTAALLVLVVTIKPAFVLVLAGLAVLAGRRFLGWVLGLGGLAAAASILALGWDVHWQFLQLMIHGTTMSKSWFYNSSLYVPFENVRLLPGFQAAPPALRTAVGVAVAVLKLGVLATLASLAWRSREFEWSDRARRHFRFLLAVLLFLLASQLLWEHYLAPLFLLMAYVWARRSAFSRAAIVLMVGITIAALGQNLIVVNFVRYRFSFDTVPAALAIGVLKAAPLLLTLVFLWRHGREWLQSYGTPAWSVR